MSLVMLCGLAGCGSSDSGERVLAVSIPPQKAILEPLTCGRFRVECMVGESTDAETAEPDMRSMARLEHAEAYLTLGGLPFEQAWIDRLKAAFPDLYIIDTTEGMSLLADHDCGHEHHSEEETAEEFDPHVWTSLRNAKIMAANMRRELVRLDPSGKTLYDSACIEISRRLDAADDSIRMILSTCRDHVFMTWHPSLGYFARDYGLTQLSVQQEGKEVSPRRLAEAITECRRRKPVLMFCDEAASAAPENEMLRSDLGIPVYSLRLMSYDFVGQLIKAAKAIAENQ